MSNEVIEMEKSGDIDDFEEVARMMMNLSISENLTGPPTKV